MEHFHNDRDYLAWVTAHPEGFVLNTSRHRDANYVVLHRATCWSVSSAERADGAYTQNGYRKTAALSIAALREAARLEGRPDGSFSKCCAHCDPLGER